MDMAAYDEHVLAERISDVNGWATYRLVAEHDDEVRATVALRLEPERRSVAYAVWLIDDPEPAHTGTLVGDTSGDARSVLGDALEEVVRRHGKEVDVVPSALVMAQRER